MKVIGERGKRHFVYANLLICSMSLAELLKSFIYRRNSNGPSTDPCGTPQVIVSSSDLSLKTDTNCFLFDR